MAADFIIDPSQAPAGNRYQSFAAYVTANGNNLTAAARGRYTEFEIASDLTENVDFSGWTTDATNGIMIYGTTRSVIWRVPGTGAYQQACDSGSEFFLLRDITLRGGTSGLGVALTLRDNGLARRVILREASTGISFYGSGRAEFCLAYGNGGGFVLRGYSSPTIINCTAIGNTGGFDRISSSGGTSATIRNCVSFGNSTANWQGWSSATQHVTSARNNAGATGDVIPQTVSGTTITGVTSADFVDTGNVLTGGYHIPSGSRLRHTHASFPTGDNTTSGTHFDIDGETLPAYSTDADRWDCGCDYYVLVTVGTRYYRATNLAAMATSSAIYRASDDAAYTVADLSAEDTLEIRSGAVVHITDNGSAPFNLLDGIKIEILNGELWFENVLTSLGQTLHGILGGKLLVGAQGRLVVRGDAIQLADLSGGSYASDRSLDNGEWDAIWGTGTKDSGGRYGEPSVLFVGSSLATAVPWLNKGNATIGDVANNTTHGRFFQFNPSNGTITWPDLVPSTSERVYCYNLMIHSANGQGTPAQSFGFDTTAKGAVDVEGCYFTGNPNFVDANGLRLDGFGVVQPLSIDHCSDLDLDVYQSISYFNEQAGSATLKNLSGETDVGRVSVVAPGSSLLLQTLRSCAFTRLSAYGYGTQSAGAYRVAISGTDDCDFGTVDAIDGGVGFVTSISVNPRIRALNHSNDQSGSNGNNAQHVLYGDASGTRGLRVDQINLLTNGQPTALDLVNMTNCGNARIVDGNYPGIVRRVFSGENCFRVLVSDISVARTTQQSLYLSGTKSRDITMQGIRHSATPSSPPSFVAYEGEDIKIKNCASEAASRYSGWALPVTDLNFLEMSSGGGTTGVLALMFSQNTKGQFTYTGTAKSNNANAVSLPAVNDRVEVEWPYDIEVGAASPYFRNVAPTVTGTGTGNLTIEYAVNNNGAGWGAWKTLNASNLNGETLSTRFRIRVRVTCATAGATNAIAQLTMETNIDSAVNYPSSLVTVRLRNMVTGSTYALYRGSIAAANQIAIGTAPGGDVNVSGIAYTVDETIHVRVRRSGTSFDPDYLEFNQAATLTESGADVYVNQVEDLVA